MYKSILLFSSADKMLNKTSVNSVAAFMENCLKYSFCSLLSQKMKIFSKFDSFFKKLPPIKILRTSGNILNVAYKIIADTNLLPYAIFSVSVGLITVFLLWGDLLFNIVENIYEGWQYFINILSLFSANFYIIIDLINSVKTYINNIISNVSPPEFVSSSIFAFVGLCIVSKIVHWGYW